jgi:tetratricopeptide (TPR) repeat protein
MGLALLIGAALVASPAAGQPVAEQERQARELFDQERYAEAATRLRAILAVEPKNRAASILLPFALARQGDGVGAIAEARRGLDVAPGNVGLQMLLAGLLSQIEAGRPEALARFQSIVDRDPGNLVARIGLAESLRGAGRELEAVNQFTLLSDRAPNDPRFAVRLGQLYGSLGDLDRARLHFERAYKLDPKNPDAVRSLALLSDVGDRAPDALRYYRELLALYPSDVSAQMAVRDGEDRLAEPSFPMPIEEMQRVPLETYVKAVSENSKNLQYRREQLDATRTRAHSRFFPSFFFSPSFGHVDRSPQPTTVDDTRTWSFSFGWNLGDIVLDPYKPTISGMQADMETARVNMVADVTSTYYQRLQQISQYRPIQRALALDPQNNQLRQAKQTVKFTILTLTERLKVLTGIP